jgi:hypothetical protein
MADSQTTTCGDFATEPIACAMFDATFRMDGVRELFNVDREVPGTPLDLTGDRDVKDYTIDRVLIPTREAFARGWDIGAVGIEIKQSGHDLGVSLAQCMDYQRAIWCTAHGFHYRLRWVFLFPARQFWGPLAALAINSHVGYACTGNGARDDKETLLKLGCGCLNPLQIDRDGQTVTAAIRGAAHIAAARGSR